MAKRPSYVWGIDIGQCALKALRCSWQDGQIVADAFDYIEYPKILSQPEADPVQLVQEALEQFLSRNSVRGDKVAISVPGQSGLAKFFKPPPVDVKRIPNIVQYEAKQQIPFPLEEVIWDFQQLVGGQVVDGFAIDTEVGLFAMKREQVYRYLKPFQTAEIEVDIIQLAPLAIYNCISHDLLTDGPDPELFDPDDPPESVVVLSMGTDATDLVVTNGFRMWQRSIPLGGNHFTKQLTKELKLTFAKAEHLKRNARQAEDPKAVFQAMRPIFNDVVNEVQRSVGFFQSLDRNAKIRGVVLLGNTTKLPGLQQYVSKNLGYEVIEYERFSQLNGSSVVTSPAFQDNVLSFGVSYGLCLQALKKGRLSTNLLPREIATQRIIRAKKPWAVATIGALLLGCALNFVFVYSVWSEVQPTFEKNAVTWDTAEKAMANRQSESGRHQSTHADKIARLEFVQRVGEEVVGASDRRLLWLELTKALNAALPTTPGMPAGVYVSYQEKPLDERVDLYIEHVESEFFPDLATWWSNPRVQNAYTELQDFLKGDQAAAPAASDQPADAAAATPAEGEAGTGSGPSGPGWVVEVQGFHYYNKSLRTGGAVHLRNTLLRNLDRGSVLLPITRDGSQSRLFTMKELGISFPILAIDSGEPQPVKVRNPDFEGSATGSAGDGYAGGMGGPAGMGMAGGMGIPGGMGMPTAPGLGGPGLPGAAGAASGTAGTGGAADAASGKKADTTPPLLNVLKHSFTVQFVWQEKRLTDRLQEIAERERAAAEAAQLAAEQAGATEPAAGDASPVDPFAAGSVAPAAGGMPAVPVNPGAPVNPVIPPNPAGGPMPAAGLPPGAAGAPPAGLPAAAVPAGGAVPVDPGVAPGPAVAPGPGAAVAPGPGIAPGPAAGGLPPGNVPNGGAALPANPAAPAAGPVNPNGPLNGAAPAVGQPVIAE